MYSHAPPGYDCPLCQLARGEDNHDPWTKQSDIVYRDDDVFAWVNPKWWGTIEGNAVVVPVDHVENIFDLTEEHAASVHRVAKRIATAMVETYGCPGISVRQHNGPAGNQDVWHYHLHVFPRYERTDLYGQPARIVPPEARLPYVEKLRGWLTER